MRGSNAPLVLDALESGREPPKDDQRAAVKVHSPSWWRCRVVWKFAFPVRGSTGHRGRNASARDTAGGGGDEYPDVVSPRAGQTHLG